MQLQEELLERFLRYAAVTSQSDARAGIVPSTPGQRRLAELLADELRSLGLAEVEITEHAVVTARLPTNLPPDRQVPAIGWIAHLDTVDVGLSPDVHPQVVRNYAGGDVMLGNGKRISADEHPELERYVGDDLVVSDGTSVLGADDKSAIANIMTALDVTIRENRPHGDICVAFVPDEEIGLLGARKLDLTKFPVDYAYTIDCCELGEVVWETFNAGSAKLAIKGVTAHPMSSKGVLVNPLLVAHDFLAMLDRAETPECTEGREGFIHAKSMQATPAEATLLLNIRDHDKAGYERKKAQLRAAADYLRLRHPRAEISLEISDTYANIADALTPQNRAGLDQLYEALEALGIPAKTTAMRGGTDGSYLSAQGLLTVNYFTGAHNFHSTAEFIPMSAWKKSLEVTLRLMTVRPNRSK